MPLKTIAAALAALTLAACVPAVASTELRQPSSLSPDPAIRYGQLANGMRYAILHNSTPRNASAVRIRFDVGSVNEADDQRGLAHLLEHMAFNGSTHIPEGELVPMLQREGLAFGADANAYTTPDQTVYSLDLPNTNARTLDAALFLYREIASELTLSDDAIQRERGVVAAEARLQQGPEFDAELARMRFFFPSARFTNRLPIGDPETVANAPPGRVRDFYAKWYRPERAMLIFVGDANSDDVENAIVRTFSSWQPRGEPPEPVDRGSIVRRGLSIGYRQQPGATTNLLFASIRPVRHEMETPESRFRAQMLTIGNNILNERLVRLALRVDAPFQSAQASADRVYRVGEMQGLNIQSTPEAWSRALAVSEQELRRALTHGFTPSEVSRQVETLRESAEFDVSNADSRTTIGYILALMYADRVGRIFTHPRDELAWLDAERPRMTVAAVNAAFREAWSDGPRVFVTSSSALAGEGAVRAAYDASMQIQVSAPEDVPTPDFAHHSFGTPNRIESQTHDPVLDVTRVRFANNVRLNIRQMSAEGNRVHIRVSVRGGIGATPREARGWQQAFVGSFMTGGLVEHDYPSIELIRGGRLANLGVTAGPDGIGLTGETSENSLLFQLQLLTAYVTAPAFRPGAMAAFHRQIEANHDSEAATAMAALQRQYLGIVTSNNPDLTAPSKDELLGWTSERLRQVVSPILDRGSVEIGIVGSAPADVVIRAVAQTFGALPSRPLVPVETIDRHVTFADPTAQPLILTHEGTPSQASAAVYWPATDDSDPRGNAVASLMSTILRQRMFDRIREVEGASYSPWAGNRFSHLFTGFGYFFAGVDTSPDQASRMLELVDEVVRSLSEGVSQDELDRARGPRLERFRMALEDTLSWMEPLSIAQSDPARARAWLERPQIYSSVTTRDIEHAANAYLRSENAVRILVLPRGRTTESN